MMIPLLFFIAGSAFATVAYALWKVWVAYRQWEPLVLSACAFTPKRNSPADVPEHEPRDDPAPVISGSLVFGVDPSRTTIVETKTFSLPAEHHRK